MSEKHASNPGLRALWGRLVHFGDGRVFDVKVFVKRSLKQLRLLFAVASVVLEILFVGIPGAIGGGSVRPAGEVFGRWIDPGHDVGAAHRLLVAVRAVAPVASDGPPFELAVGAGAAGD